MEKNINLNILLDLRELLRAAGYEVLVTRENDCSIHDAGVEGIANQKRSDMDNRLELFNSVQGAVCLSIHQNQYPDAEPRGAQVLWAPTEESQAFAVHLQALLTEALDEVDPFASEEEFEREQKAILRVAGMQPDEWEKLFSACLFLADIPLYFDDKSSMFFF